MLDDDELPVHGRLTYASDLDGGDAVYDSTGAPHFLLRIATAHDGKIITALRDDDHHVWWWHDQMVRALPHRIERPTLTCYARLLDMSDEHGWAAGDPAVIDTEQESMAWQPAAGSPVTWAVDALRGWGTLEPSSSPPYDQRTWYTTTWTDWQRLGATVDVSAHLTGFTRAEAEQIGQRVTAPPVPAHPAPVTRLSDRSAHRTRLSSGRARGVTADHGLSR